MFPPDRAHTHPLASPHGSMWSPEHPRQPHQEALSVHLSQGGGYFSASRARGAAEVYLFYSPLS